MTHVAKILTLAAVIGSAAPAAAQYNPYPNQPGYNYPAYPGQPYSGYGYNQGYTGNPVADIIDQLLGNRYNVTDRQAVRQCARAATAQAQNQYGGYGNRYGYNQGIAAPSLHVTAITDVERRSNGLRVRGVLSSSYGGQYGNRYGYQGQGYGTPYGYQGQGYGNPYGYQGQGYGNAYGYQGQGYGNAYGNRSAYGDLTFRCNVDYRGAVTDIRVSPNEDRRY